jgi:hypothetical protein
MVATLPMVKSQQIRIYLVQIASAIPTSSTYHDDW